ncbi:polyprenyl synthetase family protein [Rubrimonas cliftonensis]|uniref:Geranylgeranyl diphosphate synthase n=1 Tax=Rubrimonas cliftonensis TaxID=89524 RepID=A0A1H4APT8_9RHOB|nr:farnesyl diphosphate synthase [Rubrimonas cliftonensis]SEA37734.1 farnesyl-diphosphate synthase [Rubrimonas cliftonensis]
MTAPATLAHDAFTEALASAAARAEAALDALLPPAGEDGAGRLAAAMRHATLGGGKRLRAFLAIESAALFGVAAAQADRAAAAVELLHAYSLVHDDLPCMDDDDLRRGKPTVHVAWDEATAVLAGDALQTLAFETLAAPQTSDDPAMRAQLCLALAQASGLSGMVGGQALDLAAETAPEPLGAEAIAALQHLKTGALIAFAAEAGAILGGAPDEARTRLKGFGRDLGAAFQIRDDLLDVEGDAVSAGKRVGKDAAAGKATFVTTLGLDGARARAAAHAASARAALAPWGDRAAALAAAADYAIARRA